VRGISLRSLRCRRVGAKNPVFERWKSRKRRSAERDGDEFWIKAGNDEVVDAVTAVNHELDSVLQRKQSTRSAGICHRARAGQLSGWAQSSLDLLYGAARGSLDATDALMQRMGLDALSLSESALGERIIDASIDEAPVFEVNNAFMARLCRGLRIHREKRVLLA
jgi:hypothetical protein